jgi:hypothetical protein
VDVGRGFGSRDDPSFGLVLKCRVVHGLFAEFSQKK